MLWEFGNVYTRYFPVIEWYCRKLMLYISLMTVYFTCFSVQFWRLSHSLAILYWSTVVSVSEFILELQRMMHVRTHYVVLLYYCLCRSRWIKRHVSCRTIICVTLFRRNTSKESQQAVFSAHKYQAQGGHQSFKKITNLTTNSLDCWVNWPPGPSYKKACCDRVATTFVVEHPCRNPEIWLIQVKILVAMVWHGCCYYVNVHFLFQVATR